MQNSWSGNTFGAWAEREGGMGEEVMRSESYDRGEGEEITRTFVRL